MRRTTAFVASLPLLLVALVLIVPAPAEAHAVQQLSKPVPNSCTIYPPKEVRVWLTERPDPTVSEITVTEKASGRRADVGGTRVEGDDRKELVVALKDPLDPGDYLVAWKALSLDDGHLTKVQWIFKVRAKNDPEAARCVAGAGGDQVRGSSAPSALDVGLRAGDFLALFLASGAIGLALFVWDPLARSGTRMPSHVLRAWFARAFLAALLAIPVAIVASFGTLVVAAQQSIAGTEGVTLWEALASTVNSSLGQAYAARIALLGAIEALIAVSFVAVRPAASPGASILAKLETRAPGLLGKRAVLVALFSLLVAVYATHSLTGHPSVAGAATPQVAADIAHQVGIGLWVGGLMQLLVSVFPAIRRAAEPQRPALVYLVLARFSSVATVAVPVIIITGVLASISLGVDTPGELFTTVYGLILLLKVSLVVPVVALGSYQKLVLIPDVERKLAEPVPETRKLYGLRRFRHAVQGEVAVAIVVLMVTGLLSSTSPVYATSSSRPGEYIDWGVEGCLNVTLLIQPYPVSTGLYNFDVFTYDDCTALPLRTQRMTIQTVSPNASRIPSLYELVPIEGLPHPNHFYLPNGTFLDDPGCWSLTASATNRTVTPPWSASADFELCLKP